MTRAESYAAYSAMRAEGHTLREIAERYGRSISTVGDILMDPDGSRARERKARYNRPCVDCGRMLNIAGHSDTTQRCITCNGANQKALTRRWILASFKEWAEMFGHQPSVCDWNPQMARAKGMAWKAERHEETGRPWPSPTTVQSIFGTWNDGVRAAGFTVLRRGFYADGRHVRDVASTVVWTHERILDAVTEWHDSHGRLPLSTDWKLTSESHPAYQTAARRFGDWGSMIATWVEQRMPDGELERAA